MCVCERERETERDRERRQTNRQTDRLVGGRERERTARHRERPRDSGTGKQSEGRGERRVTHWLQPCRLTCHAAVCVVFVAQGAALRVVPAAAASSSGAAPLWVPADMVFTADASTEAHPMHA